MKRIFTILLSALVSIALLAQAPNMMDFQSLVRDASGNFVSNQTIGVQISILKTSATGTVVYRETHSVTTNTNGLLTLTIGTGTVQTGTFSSIDWSAGPYFLKTEMDVNGGTSYTLTQTTQMMSVPYALYANKAGNVPDVSALEARIAALENAASSSPVYHPDGFSVSPGHQVKFAKGNLTYNSSTQKYGLETTQYASGSDIYSGSSSSDIQTDRRYTIDDNGFRARTDIGGNWRILSAPEWGFLLEYRKNSKNLRGKATVNGVQGFIILPDGWVQPSGITFTPTIANFTTNKYTTTQWKTLENNGAIFLCTNASSTAYMTATSWIGVGMVSGYCVLLTFPNCTIGGSGNVARVRLVEDYY